MLAPEIIYITIYGLSFRANTFSFSSQADKYASKWANIALALECKYVSSWANIYWNIWQ